MFSLWFTYNLNDVNFLNFFVDMSDPNQGQLIDQSGQVHGGWLCTMVQ